MTLTVCVEQTTCLDDAERLREDAAVRSTNGDWLHVDKLWETRVGAHDGLLRGAKTPPLSWFVAVIV